MKHLDVHLQHNSRTRVELRLSNFNQLRWVVFALRQNPNLIRAIREQDSKVCTITDSLSLMKMTDIGIDNVPDRAFVVLWDGFNSYVELLEWFPNLNARADLVFLYVGQFWEAKAALPLTAAPLYVASSQETAGSDHELLVPLWFDALCGVRATLRSVKNQFAADVRHKQLSKGGWVVFCGVVRFNDKVVDSFFRGANLPSLREAVDQASGQTSLSDLNSMTGHMGAILAAIHAARPQTPGDWACVYTILNVIHRMTTLAMIRQSTDRLFVNEYGFDTHFDPYDTPSYRQNVFVDFGSTRGCDLIYPRTVDLALQHKPAVNLRLVHGQSPLAMQVPHLDLNAFLHTCRSHAERALGQLHRLQA